MEKENEGLARKGDILKKQLDDVVIDNDYLHLVLSDNAPLELYDKDSNTFTPKAVHCIMDLVSLGVSTENVGKDIDCVVKLCDRQVNRLPSRQTVDRISQRRLALAQEQLTTLSKECNQTLHTDETSKYGNQYMVYATTTSDKTHRVLGLKPIKSKSATDTLDTLIALLEEISGTCKQSKLGNEIICNIKNTMSDRASTEKLFNSVLCKYRERLLPQVVEKFSDLTEEAVGKLKTMNNFFVGCIYWYPWQSVQQSH